MIVFWTVMLLAFIAVEAITVSLVSAWFAAGALAAVICALLGGEIWLQSVLFFLVSGMMLLLRPIAKKHFTPKLTKTNVDAVIGAPGKVIARIDNDSATGKVRLGGMEWSARSTSGEILDEGTMIRVDKVEGVKVYVSPVRVTVG